MSNPYEPSSGRDRRHQPEPTNVRWSVFTLSCMTSWLLYLHRYAFGFIKPELKTEWGLGNDELGYLDSAFSFSYTVFQFPRVNAAEADLIEGVAAEAGQRQVPVPARLTLRQALGRMSPRSLINLICLNVQSILSTFGDWSLTTSWGVVTDIGGRATASVFAFNNTVAGVGSIAAPAIYGLIAEHFDWTIVFITAGCAYVLCALSWLVIDCTIPLVDD